MCERKMNDNGSTLTIVHSIKSWWRIGIQYHVLMIFWTKSTKLNTSPRPTLNWDIIRYPSIPKIFERKIFKTKNGLYKWLVIPFDLANKPPKIMCFMHYIAWTFNNYFITICLGGILIINMTLEKHILHILEYFLLAQVARKP